MKTTKKIFVCGLVTTLIAMGMSAFATADDVPCQVNAGVVTSYTLDEHGQVSSYTIMNAAGQTQTYSIPSDGRTSVLTWVVLMSHDYHMIMTVYGQQTSNPAVQQPRQIELYPFIVNPSIYPILFGQIKPIVWVTVYPSSSTEPEQDYQPPNIPLPFEMIPDNDLGSGKPGLFPCQGIHGIGSESNVIS
jgi:hypothetical protein